MKKKISIRTVLFVLFAILVFLMPAAVSFLTPGVLLNVHAEEKEEALPEESLEGEETAGEEETESEDTISGNEIPKEEAECICDSRCLEQSVNEACEVCKEQYLLCAYVTPNVRITIETPGGWHNSSTKVPVKVEDLLDSGNFKIQSVQAKISQNGSWMDITEEMKVEISENSNIYVLVTDQKGKTYEKNRHVKCFDFSKPSLNAAVNDGLLTVKAQDTESGVKAVYVNGHEFKELTNGTLSIRLQQFDAGYQYFTIQAMDHAGNMSEVYKTKNPYYADPEVKNNSNENPAEKLPVSAEATKPTTATGQVTEHTKTDTKGNTTSDKTLEEQKKAALKEALDAENKESIQAGKEFYTIETETGKVFYLIIDRTGEEEMVYFLTEISENDLLNATTDNHEVLPQNSAALESAIPVFGDMEEKTETEVPEETPEPEIVEETEENPWGIYVVLGVFAAAAIGAGYYFKVVKAKEEDFLDEDEDEEEEEIVEEEEEETEHEEFLEES